MTSQSTILSRVVQAGEDAFIQEWLAESFADRRQPAGGRAADDKEARVLLKAFTEGLRADADASLNGNAWSTLRDALAALSASRAAAGELAGDTSRFVLAMKKPLFTRLQREVGADTVALSNALWWVSTLVDRMAQLTVTTYQQAREDIIRRQQAELLELSTPVVKLWDGVLAVPMIGTLDSNRTQMVMEALLQRIVDAGAELAIIDITGVPTVDTLVAQHLLKTVTAIRLMGAECIISGIRPQIAQTIVHLGIDLQGITTKATLADALALALRQTGHVVSRAKV